MLHEDPLMLDIDVDHWRNLQALLLDSAKERRRIVVIHEDGEVLKLVHSARLPILGEVERVDDPHAVAAQLYRDNVDTVDFVAVFERRACDEYFGRFQGTWRPDEDLDVFVHRTYALLDEYPDGIVTHPERARHTLGLQWRLGAPYEDVTAAIERTIPSASTAVLGIFDGDALWASLVLGLDADGRVHVVTTVDTSELSIERGREAIAEEVVAWVNRRYPQCSLGLFASLEHARAFLASTEKLALLQELADRGELIAEPIPTTLPLRLAAATS
ncbi:MAG TPA: hypothetical protein VHD91_03750 [Gaiellaceae bacterium]|nr:hypothetical protein [Gaiellaceae bacterium]